MTWYSACIWPDLRTKDGLYRHRCLPAQVSQKKGLAERSFEKSTLHLHLRSLTWNLKNDVFNKYDFFFWGIHFQGQMLVFVGYISVSSINFAAWLPNLQRGATVNEGRIEIARVNGVVYSKTEAKLSFMLKFQTKPFVQHGWGVKFVNLLQISKNIRLLKTFVCSVAFVDSWWP